jgi:hypothetical protein
VEAVRLVYSEKKRFQTPDMSLLWFKNLVGCKLTDAEMRDIPHPYAELYTHVLMKSVQSFGLLGTVVIGPVSALLSAETRTIEGVRFAAVKYGKWGVLLGCIAGPLMTYARLKSVKANQDAVYDRSYRLRNNRDQIRVDRGSIVGAVGGAAVAVPMGACPVFGGLVGMSAGIISMAFYNNVCLKKKCCQESKKKE